MKVLHVLNELMASGAEVRMCRSAPYWRKARIEGEFLSTGEEVGPYAKNLEEAGYRIHHIPFRKALRFFLAFSKLVRAGRYDIVHIHCERASFYYGLAAWLAGARIVRTICSTFQFNGSLALRRSIQRRFFRWLGGKQVSVSPSVEKNEFERFGNRTTLIINWYDDTRFSPPSDEERGTARNQYDIQEDDLVVVSVGNCAPVKNHCELLKALAKIKEDIPFVYIHVGKEEDGEPERELAKELGISDRTQFLGYTQNAIQPLYAADLYVMCSLYEGFSVAALEALGVGLPAVLSDVTGLWDLKGIPCTFWAKPEAESIAERIRQVAAMHEAERASVGQQASREVKRRYGIERGIRAYVEVYENLIKKSKAV
jgi:glycosyltransferase involved in cell wall biosynthesis